MLAVSCQATNEVVYRVPKATQEEMTAAVDSCSRAFRTWSETSILARQQIFLRYQQMIKDNIVSQGDLYLSKNSLLSHQNFFCIVVNIMRWLIFAFYTFCC